MGAILKSGAVKPLSKAGEDGAFAPNACHSAAIWECLRESKPGVKTQMKKNSVLFQIVTNFFTFAFGLVFS
jgi:hypothetical protein